KRRVASEREGLQEGELALLCGLLGEEPLRRLPRARHEMCGAALDQAEERARAPGGEAGQQLVSVEEPPERIRGHGRRATPSSRRPPACTAPERGVTDKRAQNPPRREGPQ